MPTVPLLTAAAEVLANKLLALDPDAKQGLKRLQGKRLVINLTDVNQRIALAISEQVDVLALQELPEGDDLTCVVTTRLAVLPKLKEASQLTQLIKAGELEVSGELAIAQQFSAVMNSLDIDWEEQLAQHTGDVIANQVFSIARSFGQQLKRFGDKSSLIIGSALTDEKQLAAHKLAVLHFSDEVSRLRDDAERLESRLSRLESKQS